MGWEGVLWCRRGEEKVICRPRWVERVSFVWALSVRARSKMLWAGEPGVLDEKRERIVLVGGRLEVIKDPYE